MLARYQVPGLMSMRVALRCQILLLLGILLLLVGGCSNRFLYNKLDTFIVWQVQDYVELTDPQKESLRADIQLQLDAVRQNEMLRVADLLKQSAADVESGAVTSALLDRRYHESLEIYDDLMLGIVPLSERFLRSLSASQVSELFENLEDVNDEMYEDYSGRTPETREKNRNKSAINAIEKFTGRLKRDQRLLVTDALARMDDASEEWIDYQRLWQARFRELIETRPPDPGYRERLTQLFVYPRQMHSEEYRQRVHANRMILNAMLEELFAGLSDRQRRRAVSKLTDYAETLSDLAAAN